MLSTLILASLALAQDPGCATSPDDLDLTLTDAESAYELGDIPGVRAAAWRAGRELGCLTAVVPAPMAARFHRVRALEAYLEGDEMTAIRAFGAARLADPAYTFPDTLVPEGDSLHEIYAAYSIDKLKGAKLKSPPEGAFYLDGVAARKRPEGLPFVAQIVAPDGQVLVTALMKPEDPLPTPGAPAPEAAPPPPPAEESAFDGTLPWDDAPPADDAPVEE